MEITRLHAPEPPLSGSYGGVTVVLSPQAEDYLDALRHEHQRFLLAVGEASSRLGGESDELARLAAVHSRLTRQFFDAQRSLLRNRAEVDAQVEQITQDAESNSSMLAEAVHRRVQAKLHHPAGKAEQCIGSPMVAATEASQAAQGPWLMSATTRPQDLAALAGEIDGVFEQREPDGVVAQRQLGQLLDAWWGSEQQEARAAIDDAHARSAVRQHLAVAEASSAVRSSNMLSESLAVSAGRLPQAMIAVLDLAAATDLAGVLAALAASLEVPDVAPSAEAVGADQIDVPLVSGAILRFEALPGTVADEAFHQFWSKEPSLAPSSRRSRWWLSGAVMFPIMLASSLAVLATAWVR